MTRDQVLRLATQCGDDVTHTLPEDLAFLEQFAEAVAAAEREACAKVCEMLTKPQALDLLMLLSVLESWPFSTGEPLPDHLFETMHTTIDNLRNELLKED